MKKFTAILLLLVFLCNIVGIFGLFFILKQDNYESVFNGKTDELNLVRLVIPKSETILWEQKDEIVYKGEYYDVFSKTEDAKNIYLFCYSDSKDDRLTEAFQKHLNEESSCKKSADRLPQINVLSYPAQSFSWNIPELSSEKISTQFLTHTLAGFKSVSSPPPDFLV